MSAIGQFTFVLHSHLPHVHPHRYYGATWFYDTLADTYLPLLNTLYDLKDDAISYRLAIGFSSILLEQFANKTLLNHFDNYLQEKIRFAEYDIAYFAEKAPDTHSKYLAGWYKTWYERLRESFNTRFNRDFIGAFKALADEGYIETFTSTATHGYLPLLDEKSIRAQLFYAIQTHKHYFASAPRGVWLPECAYKPGMDAILADMELNYFFTEAHPITGGQPIGVASGDVLGLYGEAKRRYMTPTMTQIPMRKQVNTLRPYWVGEDDTNHSGVAVI
ncbi:MAG: hypothetical protein KJ043_14095, partial [Anaerolineae bacterium]|nr:hypothetical protein [Anaerolineae bacterium]